MWALFPTELSEYWKSIYQYDFIPGFPKRSAKKRNAKHEKLASWMYTCERLAIQGAQVALHRRLVAAPRSASSLPAHGVERLVHGREGLLHLLVLLALALAVALQPAQPRLVTGYGAKPQRAVPNC